jgi:hypothetical protein
MSLRRIALGFPLTWSHRRPCSLSALAGAGRSPYFIRWDPSRGVYGEDWAEAPRDDSGVLLTGAERVYHPIRVAQFALHLHERWCIEHDETARQDFLTQAAWLRDNQDSSTITGLYRFDFPWPKYGARAGWVSAMAQGEAISVLLRAEHIAPNKGYADAAWRAAEPFRHDISEGGVVWRNGPNIFFEEVANVNAPHILNGCIFALWGLWELWVSAPESWQGESIARCVETLKRWLPSYDTGWWTLYSLMRTATGRTHLSTLKYHAFHIAQMQILGAMFDEPQFTRAAERWTSYIDERSSRGRLLASTMISLPERFLHLDTVAGGAHT